MKIKINKSNNAANYDEYQKSIMYKCASQAFIFLMILIFANASIKMVIGREWAMPLIEGLSFIYISLIYYLTNIYIKGAYVPFKGAGTLLISGMLMLSAASVQFVFLIIAYKQKGIEGFYKNGILHDFSLLGISFIFMIYLGLLMIFAWRKSRKELQNDEKN